MEHSTHYSGCIADGQERNKLRFDEMFDLICLLFERDLVVVSNGNES
jgi:hypothetical protein